MAVCKYTWEYFGIDQPHNIQSVATELSDLKYMGLIFLVENFKKKKVLGKQNLLMFAESLLPSERDDRKFPD